MEFWTNSNDECGAVCDAQRRFIKAFKTYGKLLQIKVRFACWIRGPHLTSLHPPFRPLRAARTCWIPSASALAAPGD